MTITPVITWKLILTQIAFFSQFNSSVPILQTTIVDNFATEQACRQAGAQVEVDARTITSTTQLTLSTTFSCVKDH